MGFVLQCKVQLVATRFQGKHIASILSVTGFPLCRAKEMWRTGWINFKSERKTNLKYKWRHKITLLKHVRYNPGLIRAMQI